MLNKFTRILREEYKHVSPVMVPSIALFVFFLGWGVVGPFFSINAKNILVSPFLIGLFISLWGLTRLFTDFLVGAYVDVSDAKKIVSISFLSYFFVGLGYYFINSIGLLLLWRIVHAICGSFFWVGVWAYLHKTIPAKYREEDLTFQTIVRSIPSLFAPFFGALIFSTSNPKNVFLVMSIFSVISCVIFFLRSKPVKVRRGVTVNKVIQKEFGLFKRMRGKVAFIGLMLAGVFTVSTAYGTFMPIYLFEMGYSSVVIALVAVMGSVPIFFTLPVGIFADRIGRRPVLWWGLILLALSLLGIYFSADLIAIVLSVIILGFSFAIITPTANALVGDMAVDGEQGITAGMGEMFKDIGALIGPFVGGLLIGEFDFKVMILCLVAVVAILLMLTKRFKTRKILS